MSINSNRTQRYLKTGVSTLLIYVLLQFSATSSAALLDLSEAPLFLGISVVPNVFVVLDDSGSMDYELLTRLHWNWGAYDKTAKCRAVGGSTDLSDSTDCGTVERGGLITLHGPPGYTSDSSFKQGWEFRYVDTCRVNPVTTQCQDDNLFVGGCASLGSLAACTASPGTAKDIEWRARSAALNGMYYNPLNTYKPWNSSNLDIKFVNADFKNVRVNPNPNADNGGYTRIRSLSGFVYYLWKDDKGFEGDGCKSNNICIPCNPKFLDTSTTRPHRGTKINYTICPNGIVDYWDSRLKVTVNDSDITVEEIKCNPDSQGNLNCLSDSGTKKTGLKTMPTSWSGYNLGSLAGRPLADEQQNIANWYQYHRRRLLTTKAAVDELITTEPKYRYGLNTINTGHDEYLFEPVPSDTGGAIDFLAYNKAFLTKLMQFNGSGLTTPLRGALDRAGKYYKGDYATQKNRFGVTIGNPITYECQQNYTLLMTDGYWNDTFSGSYGGVDDGHLVTKGTSLGDIAWYYYIQDLRLDLGNNVRPTSVDLFTHQHMVTFGVGFGVEGWLSDDNGDGWPDTIVTDPGQPWSGPIPPNKTPSPEMSSSLWGNPFTASGCSGTPGECPEKTDDLWHAAYNSRGFFASARSPAELAKSMRDALRVIEERKATVAAAAVNSTVYSTGSQIFQARFNSRDWSGQLLAFTIDAKGGLDNKNPDWDAGGVINGQHWSNTGERVIMTYDPAQRRGIPFRLNQLTPGQVTALGINPSTGQPDVNPTTGQPAPKSQERLDFLRGRGVPKDSWLEQNNFRDRSSKLGDIVNSDLAYVAAPIFRYPDTLNNYPTFRTAQANRTPVIYIGANDGMLHGFNAKKGSDQGKEVVAYVPSKLFGKLNLLTHPDYTYKNQHTYFVDGSPTVNDVYFGSEWRTVLVGGLGAGGQSIYALNITNPQNFTEQVESSSNSNRFVLWEFNDDGASPYGDKDLGYIVGKPVIARTTGGTWVAIFGNGYNNTKPDGYASTTGNAVLYVVDISNGLLLKKIDTLVGMSKDPTGNQRPNGLASPVAVDVDDDFNIDYIYAGDLFGNLWKFDARNPNPSNWDVAYKSGTTPQPLFVAVSPATDNPSKPQPITSRPIVDIHPLGRSQGLMVYFGTGKYFEKDDNKAQGQPTQSFYGIWDRDEKDTSGILKPLTAFTRDQLLKQSITEEQLQVAKFGNLDLRLTSDNAITWFDQGNPKDRGWYLDFVLYNNNRGEKVIGDPLLRNKRVIFTTLVPSENPCGFGGTSWLMALDAASGSRLKETPFDLNKDDDFTNDLVVATSGPNANHEQTVSGRSSMVGIFRRPGLIRSGNIIITVSCGTSGECEDAAPPLNPGYEDAGRQSWRQLY